MAGNTSRSSIDINTFDTCIIPGVNFNRWFDRLQIPVIVNLTGPALALSPVTCEKPSPVSAFYFAQRVAKANRSLLRGDFFICGGLNQKLFYEGMLNALGRLNHYHMAQLDRLICIIPPAAPVDAPVKTKQLFRGVLFEEKCPVILWAAGIYPWYDAQTVIQAFERVLTSIPEAKLVFAGAYNPGASEECNKEYHTAHTYISSRGLLNKNVFFIDWQPYGERANIYLESDIAVICHNPNIETEISARARIVDILWGGLPLITNGIDNLSGLINSSRAGVIAEQTPESFADAFVRLLKDSVTRNTMAQNARRLVTETLNWDTGIIPLDAFCKKPYFAQDKNDRHLSWALNKYLVYRNAEKPMSLLNQLIISYKTRMGSR